MHAISASVHLNPTTAGWRWWQMKRVTVNKTQKARNHLDSLYKVQLSIKAGRHLRSGKSQHVFVNYF